MSVLEIEITQEDLDAGGRDPCKVFSRAIGRAVGCEVLVHKGPLILPSFEARTSPAYSRDATSYFLRCEPASWRLPGRLQVMASAILYGPAAEQIWVTQGKGEEAKRVPYARSDLLQPGRHLLRLDEGYEIVALRTVPPSAWVLGLDEACRRYQAAKQERTDGQGALAESAEGEAA